MNRGSTLCCNNFWNSTEEHQSIKNNSRIIGQFLEKQGNDVNEYSLREHENDTPGFDDNKKNYLDVIQVTALLEYCIFAWNRKYMLIKLIHFRE